MGGTLSEDVDRAANLLTDELLRLNSTHHAQRFRPEWWNKRLLEWSVSHPSFKTQLFRFVDVFPATSDDADVLRHLEEYFEEADLPRALDLGLNLAEQMPFGKAISSVVARRMIGRMAEQFIAGSSPADAVERLGALWESGTASTVDVLGEKTVTQSDATHYLTLVDALLAELIATGEKWPARPGLESDDLGPIPRVNVSVKPTALSPHYLPLSGEAGIAEALTRLGPVLAKAAGGRALIHIDMEHYEVKDLTIELVSRLLGEPRLAEHHLGVTIQSYLTDAYEDLETLIARSANRDVPLTIRLVKGAYWDTETIHAEAEGWPSPVFTEKSATDANFERCARLLHDHHGAVRAAFGSHNLSSLAYAIAYARSVGVPDNGYEIQTLYGMGEPFHEAIRNLGIRLRVYAPVGDLLPGMAYLVRRLLENTANESFVRAHLGAHDPSASEHRRSLHLRDLDAAGEGKHDPRRPASYLPEPLAEWHRTEVRREFGNRLEHVRDEVLGSEVPAIIDGIARSTESRIASVNPSDPDQLVASSAESTEAHVDEAIEVALRTFDSWRHTPVRERAAVLFRTAEWMRARRNDLAAIEVFEAGKPWSEADADICESIDYCEYYGREMLRYDAGGTVQSPPGEVNALSYAPRGVAVVIAPWNFPLAIPTGMVTAALVAGNTVILKPAEQTPLIASKLVEGLRESGLPDGVIAFLPGRGEVIGARLVADPRVALIAFTGSKAVGLEIIAQAAIPRDGQRLVKKVIAEMGGKNALIVDSDADLDQAVPITIASAFGYSGQKCSACSRVIVVGNIYDEFVGRLVGAAADLRIGSPEDSGVQVGPLIDDEAYRRVRGYVERAEDSGDVLIRREDIPAAGFFVGPTIVGGVRPGSPIEADEIFGPVLAVMAAPSIEEAVSIANDTAYALTAGIVSRSPANVRLAASELRAGNVYVNRTITGAVVGRQPFGGYGLSGVGSKTGGPDYLLQFLEPRVVSENTIRQGSAPSHGPEAKRGSPSH